MHEPILVTALVVTCNHRPYIATAIESVLMQKAEFPVEILISEDASTDGTDKVVQQYAAAHPNRIRVLSSEKRIRSNEVVARGLRCARGRYVALLDGDDLWTSDTKLRRQADYLETHPDITAIFHNAVIANGTEVSDKRWTRSDQPTVLALEDIWAGNPFATCAGMMRTRCVREIPPWYSDFFPITDWPLYIFCARAGKLAFVDDVVGIYRLHAGGLFSSLPDKAKLDTVEAFYHRMSRVMEPFSAAAARAACSRYFFDWAKQYLDAGDFNFARDCFWRSLRGGGIGQSVSRWEAVRLSLRLLSPISLDS
jgi:glycosyltransferase involved in cell wall biosynthesis